MRNILFVIMFGIVLFVGCKPTEKIQYVDREKIVYQNIIQHDSIFNDVHDSVFETIYQKGDTIYKIKYKEKIKFKEIYVTKTDTLIRDSIEYVAHKETITKKVVPKWCYFSLVVCVLFIIFAIHKLYKWLS